MLKFDSELQFLFPFRSSNRFVCARGSAKARFPPPHKRVDYFPYFNGEYKKGGCLPPFNENAGLGFHFNCFGY